MKKTLAVLLLGTALSVSALSEIHYNEINLPKNSPTPKTEVPTPTDYFFSFLNSQELNFKKEWSLNRRSEVQTGIKIDFKKTNLKELGNSIFNLRIDYVAFNINFELNLNLIYRL